MIVSLKCLIEFFSFSVTAAAVQRAAAIAVVTTQRLPPMSGTFVQGGGGAAEEDGVVNKGGIIETKIIIPHPPMPRSPPKYLFRSNS